MAIIVKHLTKRIKSQWRGVIFHGGFNLDWRGTSVEELEESVWSVVWQENEREDQAEGVQDKW